MEYVNWLIRLVGREFVRENWVQSQVASFQRLLKWNLILFNTQQYKVGIKGNVEQSRERSSALPYTVM